MAVDDIPTKGIQIPRRRPRGLFAPGFFLTVEGMDGAGKSSLVEKLVGRLLRWGIPVSVYREPGGTSGGEAMREVFKDASHNLDPNAQGLLMFASREQLIREEILPALNRGEVVICDRYIDSSYAMQYWAGKMESSLFQTLAERAFELATPDLTLYLDIPVEVSRDRQQERGLDTSKDAYESQGDDYHQAIRDAYQLLEPHHGRQRVTTLDATQDMDAVFDDAWQLVKRRVLKPRLGNVLDKSWWYHHTFYLVNQDYTNRFGY